VTVRISSTATRVLHRGAAIAAVAAMATVAVPTAAMAASHAPAKTQAQTLVARGPDWAVYANAKLPGVKPVIVTPGESPRAIVAALRPDGGHITCGIVTCTLYIDRHTTKAIDNKVARFNNASIATITLAFAAACAPIGGFPAIVCGGVGAIGGSFAIDQFNQAAHLHDCIAIKYFPLPTPDPTIPPVPVGLNSDNSKNCRK
jgi:hypothetical protein